MAKRQVTKKVGQAKTRRSGRNHQKKPKIVKQLVIATKLAKPTMRQVVKSKLRSNHRNNKKKNPQNSQDISIEKIQKQIFLPEEEKYQCPICLQLMIYPTLAPCGHASCLPCFEETLKYQKDCSICRQTMPFYEFRPSKLLVQIVSVFKDKLQTKEQKEAYDQRLQDFLAKEKLRNISITPQIGDSIDYCKNWKWYEGKITDVIIDSSKQTILQVQSSLNVEQIEDYRVSSRLIAKHKHFTQQNNEDIVWTPPIRNEFDFFSYGDDWLLDVIRPVRVEAVVGDFYENIDMNEAFNLRYQYS